MSNATPRAASAPLPGGGRDGIVAALIVALAAPISGALSSIGVPLSEEIVVGVLMALFTGVRKIIMAQLAARA